MEASWRCLFLLEVNRIHDRRQPVGVDASSEKCLTKLTMSKTVNFFSFSPYFTEWCSMNSAKQQVYMDGNI